MLCITILLLYSYYYYYYYITIIIFIIISFNDWKQNHQLSPTKLIQLHNRLIGWSQNDVEAFLNP